MINSSSRPRRVALLFASMVSAVALGATTLAAAPASAAPGGTGSESAGSHAVMKAPSNLVQEAVGSKRLGGVSPQARYVQNTRCYYWGCDALVNVASGEVSLGVFCPGYGWYQSSWIPVGIWRVVVDCGSFIPVTQPYRYQTRG